ncbi:MAG: aminotransferase class V-fold PLP-dependent enzyme [Cyanobacteria bacterium SZAS LIN-5]|nr:aminotransferase class V-fold PLP-dependent enzyme [Cyanobacteria bacterium SZAS LIN-5]
MDAAIDASSVELNVERIKKEFPIQEGCLYLNTGSCGRKPQSVLQALSQGWQELNVNPTITTFWDESALGDAKEAAARLFDVPGENLLLVQNTTQGLHFLMHNFLLEAGDEFITTTSEHGSVGAIARYLAETRGIKIHRVEINPHDGNEVFTQRMTEKLSSRTRLVLVSEISSYTAWRPDLSELERITRDRNIPLLVDGAHCGGQIICRPGQYRLWVGSGHKWLGGPNGTGFVYVAPDLVPRLQPLWLGDEYFKLVESHGNSLARFESQGTTDVVRWRGLTAAINLQLQIGPDKIYRRELELAKYLRNAVRKLNPNFRTPEGEPNCALLVMYWDADQVPVPHLRDHLWKNYKIWVQPDFMNENPGLGVRVSCHYSNSESDIDRFVEALAETLRK